MASHLTRLRVGAATSAPQQVQNTLLKKSPSCFDLCYQGTLWIDKEHLFGWCSNDWHTHTPQMDALAIHRAGPKCNSSNTQCANIRSFTPTISQGQIHSFLHISCCICSSMYQLRIPQHFWVSWAPNAGTAFDPLHKMYFSRLKVQANYSLPLRWPWIRKCWAQ